VRQAPCQVWQQAATDRGKRCRLRVHPPSADRRAISYAGNEPGSWPKDANHQGKRRGPVRDLPDEQREPVVRRFAFRAPRPVTRWPPVRCRPAWRPPTSETSRSQRPTGKSKTAALGARRKRALARSRDSPFHPLRLCRVPAHWIPRFTLLSLGAQSISMRRPGYIGETAALPGCVTSMARRSNPACAPATPSCGR
jgi:hypothetical protein